MSEDGYESVSNMQRLSKLINGERYAVKISRSQRVYTAPTHTYASVSHFQRISKIIHSYFRGDGDKDGDNSNSVTPSGVETPDSCRNEEGAYASVPELRIQDCDGLTSQMDNCENHAEESKDHDPMPETSLAIAQRTMHPRCSYHDYENTRRKRAQPVERDYIEDDYNYITFPTMLNDACCKNKTDVEKTGSQNCPSDKANRLVVAADVHINSCDIHVEPGTEREGCPDPSEIDLDESGYLILKPDPLINTN